MTKVLFIQPPQVVRNIISLVGIEMPLNLAYLSSAIDSPKKTLRAYGHKINEDNEKRILNLKIESKILDLQLYFHPWKKLQEVLKKENPDIVGITAFTIQAQFVDKIARIAKEITPATITIFGGIHASALPEESLIEMPNVDMVVIGEGEITLLEIMAKIDQFGPKEILKDPAKLEDVKGIAYKIWDVKKPMKETTNENKHNEPKSEAIKIEHSKSEENNYRIYRTRERPFIRYIDGLPYPAREKLEYKKYHPFFVNYWRLPTTGILGSRGCPYNCAYCSKAVYHRVFRPRDPARVIEEMQYCEEKFGIKDFRFFDDAVTTSPKWIVEFSKLLIKKDLHYTWNGMSRVDTVNPAILKLMRQAGCYHIKFGVETASAKIKREIHKTFSNDVARRAIKYTKDAGIEAQACLMINFPNESVKSMYNTIRFAIELNPHFVIFSILKPLPGSEIFNKAEEENKIIHKKWEYYGHEDPPILKDQIPGEFSNKLVRWAYNRFYLRVGYVWTWLKYICNDFSWVKVKRLLAGIKTFLPSHRDYVIYKKRSTRK
ncbi:MAG: B12-binding domain-containing radical SAM protein [Promethearchaeota archaeon]